MKILNFQSLTLIIFCTQLVWAAPRTLKSSSKHLKNHKNHHHNTEELIFSGEDQSKEDESVTFPNVCPVGRLGYYAERGDVVPNDYATMMACEKGEHYCKMEFIQFYPDNEFDPTNNWNNKKAFYYGSCTNKCENGPLSDQNQNQCYTGYDSSTAGFYCLTGNFQSAFGSDPLTLVPNGAVPTFCSKHDRFCIVAFDRYNVSGDENYGYCASQCTAPTFDIFNRYSCYEANNQLQIPNKLGNLCYVGYYGFDAIIKGCNSGLTCDVVSNYGGSGKTAGVCSSTGCTTDYCNKLGSVCYVGKFGINARQIACPTGYICKRTTFYNAQLTGTYTMGSCEQFANCNENQYASSEEFFDDTNSQSSICCAEDLCNAFKASGIIKDDVLVEFGSQDEEENNALNLRHSLKMICLAIFVNFSL